MFDWFWEFLYSISKILFQIIDGMVSIANMLCGIEPISVGNQKTDFLSYLFENDKIMYGFIGAALIGVFLIMVFTVFAMIKAIKGKSEVSPGQVAVKVIKTLGIFLFVPAVMIAFTKIVNELMIVLYKATSDGSASMGEFLFKSFLPDGMDTSGNFGVDYGSTDAVDAFLSNHGYELSDYRFFFSWICCIPLLFALAKGLLNFVERTISIVMLFIASPISISTSVVDDGSHFKLWRDQVLVKFLTGYGVVIGLNVYILIVSIISSSSVQFFSNSFLDFLFKMAFTLGGAVSLERVMALVGNLVSSGAGSNEMREAAMGYNSMKDIAGGIGKVAKGVAKAPIKAANLAKDLKVKGFKQTASEAIGLKTDRDYMKEGYNVGGNSKNKPIQQQILDAILGLGEGKKNGGGGGENDNVVGNDAEPSGDLGGSRTSAGAPNTAGHGSPSVMNAILDSVNKPNK